MRAAVRPRRAVLVSSPIGLGHAWRDVAIARELRRRTPGLEVHWLAQHPVTTLLEACGETVHPASAELASEAAGVDAEAGEHELHAFQMLRRFDEIFCANFMVFHDLVARGAVRRLDRRRGLGGRLLPAREPGAEDRAVRWLTDFVGVLPMPDGGEREAFLAADNNAQMVEHVARNPRLRDRSIFVGDPDDIVPGLLGPGLPAIRDWTEQRFEFAGYITGFDPAETPIAMRSGPSSATGPTSRSASSRPAVPPSASTWCGESPPRSRRRNDASPELRMILVAGPRLDSGSLPDGDGLETHGYVHRLYRQLAACDLAISHGGLSTTMELTAADALPYFPLRQHFEQNRHVAHRLDRHGAGRRMDFDSDGPAEIAAAIAEEIGREPRYLAVEQQGAARAAAVIAGVVGIASGDALPRAGTSGSATGARAARRDHRRGRRARRARSTLIEGDDVRTGVTVVFPHEGDLRTATPPSPAAIDSTATVS